MTNVYLYGELRNKFGKEFKFHLNSAKEAFLAINANKKGFLNEVKKLAMQGIHYRIVVDEQVLQDPKELEIKKTPEEIHIVPVVWGAGKNGALIAVGLILTIATYGAAAGWFAAGSGLVGAGSGAAAMTIGSVGFNSFGAALISLGAGLVMQGIMGLLFPPPKPDFNQEVQAGGKSYLFGNKPSNTSQGQAVPVGYGRLKIGSSQVSSAIDHYALNTDIKQLMTPVDQPINDYIELNAEDENSLVGPDAFSSNQAVDMEDTVTFCSTSILNSYIDITANGVADVTTAPVEVVVRRNGQIISNPDSPLFDDDITYEWEELSNDNSKGQVVAENPYSTKPGLAIRAYHPFDFKHQTNFEGLISSDDNFFTKYQIGDLVKFGPAQFNEKLIFGTFDETQYYYSGELINHPTGNNGNIYFQAIVTGENGLVGFSGRLPTGVGPSVNSAYWRKILPPANEYLYKCTAPTKGHLPTTGEITTASTWVVSTLYNVGNFVVGSDSNSYRCKQQHTSTNNDKPITGPSYANFWEIYRVGDSVAAQNWTRIDSPTTSEEMETLFNLYPAVENGHQYVHDGKIEVVNESNLNNSASNVDNYGMELLGYFYVPTVGADGTSFIKDVFELGTGTGFYEIMKIGQTGQWSGLGFTGAGGVALTPRVGSTFYKKNVQGLGDGRVMLVGDYKFKLDSHDASDLYIDSTLASSYYGEHGMFSGFASPFAPTQAEINALHSTTTTIPLTAGYHRLLARVQDQRGGEGISIYYQYDTNKDGAFGDWTLVPKERLFHAYSDVSVPQNQKFSDVGKRIVDAGNMISSEEYKIHTVGDTLWTEIGSASSNVGAVFVKTGTSGGSGKSVEDFITYSEQVSAESNRSVRFLARRPRINNVVSPGYSQYKARYRCKVKINNRQTLYTSPVKINIQFLSTTNSFRGIGRPVLPVQAQTA